jgi:hypothetical protein
MDYKTSFRALVINRIVGPMTPPEVPSRPAFARMWIAYLHFSRLKTDSRDQTCPPNRHLPDLPALLAATAELFRGFCALLSVYM